MRKEYRHPDTGELISRQRHWQLMHAKAGLCEFCQEPAVTTNKCLKHAVASRERNRSVRKTNRRNRSLTYMLEEAAKRDKPIS